MAKKVNFCKAAINKNADNIIRLNSLNQKEMKVLEKFFNEMPMFLFADALNNMPDNLLEKSWSDVFVKTDSEFYDAFFKSLDEVLSQPCEEQDE